ncbi:hypothetical protein OF829_15390 [Sphingomonas sp. LB-2]|uniref:hypothetical protein n=1 Tax=Sphingomonas caeni TaxID=2984949 RepID=UPI00222E6AB5|nr:hypothetical protein [Sphingomonas caeni]MCW3848619.1 hypothetical protein [Sphingomonas caeni]
MTQASAAKLLSELDKLQRLHADFAVIAARTDDGRRKDLIALRRVLAEQIAVVGNLADPFFATLGDELSRTYRAKFSQVRSAAAMHQANWPAVRIGEANDAYLASAKIVRETNHDFVAWAQRAIKTSTSS